MSVLPSYMFGPCRGQKRASDSLGLKYRLLTVIMQMLEILGALQDQSMLLTIKPSS